MESGMVQSRVKHLDFQTVPLPDLIVTCEFVSCEIGLAACDLDDSFTKGLGLHVGDVERMAITVAID